jgi:LAGLIDADG DNA endonuclease family
LLNSNSIIFLTKSFHSSSSNYVKRNSQSERSKFKLDFYLKQILIGNIPLRGDVYMRRFSEKANARIIFRQGSINASYLLHLYNLYQEFVTTPPAVSSITDKNTGKIRYNLSFATLALPCFNELYEAFYLDGKKIIPNNIADLLSEVSLAYWIMDDGSFTGSGLKLHTNAFSLEELNLLIKALDKNFSIKASVNVSNREKSQFSLYISKNQMSLVKDLVIKHMHPDMLYKLNIDKQ